jgi:hypothetical protein
VEALVLVGVLVYLAFIAVVLAGMWKAFAKAGQPGWGVLVPFYNLYCITQIARRPGWWFVLMLIPFVNFFVAIFLMIDIAKNFGKGGGFAVGLILLGFIFWPILGFGSAQYMSAERRGFAVQPVAR